ncbi:ricin-type beta-trefoil lectin protein [Kribbella voronezhensis]|uniref:Ricin-type beta-trefoil lectin protein n=1 Tax=Kribbella voronezhensis TaxID=2512212 RepID=A0A4V3FJP9_9ACTN|nr:RICIN domain-containing protein [Kribbella voronezhensis]TDU87213.1 ricin-type beta-trefoil lectin protein [Kribbella voronezhensis]
MTRGVAPLRPPPSRRRVVVAIAAAAAAAVTTTALTAVVSSPAASAAISPTGWNTVVSKNSSKCVDARAAATANGTAVQQQACNSTTAQQWQFQPTADGYVRVNAFNNAAQALDVTNVSAADSAPIQLWSYSNGLNQQWLPVEEADGAYHLVNRNSGKCLDVPGASTADGLQLQQYTCNGTAAQSFRVNPVDGTPPTEPPAGQPDLGPNVSIFDPSMSSSTIQNKLNSVFSQQERNQFGEERFALLFKPGTYNVSANVGFYTQVAGLGLTPDSVNINGAVHVEADWFPPQNATQNFWRGAEGLTITPPGGLDRWAVSQASSYRRNHLKGNLALDDGGWASGGYMADTVVDGQVRSGSQQQWISRNTTWGSWTGQNWNMVFVGAQNAPAGTFPNPPYTKVAQTPVVREKPYLYVDASGNYQVFVPAVRNNSAGPGWTGGNPAGQSLPISQFYIVKPGATAATINAQLADGKNLLFTPGVYRLSDTLRVNRPDTVVLGLGLATLMPTSGTQSITVADVDGVKIAGLLIDAAPTNSPLLMEIGPSGSSADHSANPTSLHDVYFRIGGAAVGKATETLRINSNNVIVDHTWLWRGDHSYGVGWNTNTAATGLVVNGNDVTAYGLFVEHYQKYQTIWNGNGGRTYFYQNEMPYDPPNQFAWMNGSTRGYAAYKVADSVTTHEAWGLGSYCVFNDDPSIVADRAFEVPNKPGVRFHSMVTVSLGGKGTIAHIINTTGGPSNSSTNVAQWVNYP